MRNLPYGKMEIGGVDERMVHPYGKWELGVGCKKGDQGKGNPIYKMGAQDMGMRKEGMRGG
jgi:hypothetical protein